MRKFWYAVCYALCRIGLFFWHPISRFEGRERVCERSAVICSNHSGMADPIWILLALRQDDIIHIMAKEELNHVPVLSAILRYFGIIFVRRGQHDRQAVDVCVKALDGENEKLLVFIEGTRCKDGKHPRAHTGAIRIACAAGVPLVPVYVSRGRRPFSPVRVVFGDPVETDGLDENDHTQLQSMADTMLKTIYELGEDSYADTLG